MYYGYFQQGQSVFIKHFHLRPVFSKPSCIQSLLNGLPHLESEFKPPPIFCCRPCIFGRALPVHLNYTLRSCVDTPSEDYILIFTLASSQFPKCDQNLHNQKQLSIFLWYIVIISTVNDQMSKQQEQFILQNTCYHVNVSEVRRHIVDTDLLCATSRELASLKCLIGTADWLRTVIKSMNQELVLLCCSTQSIIPGDAVVTEICHLWLTWHP